MSLESSDPLSPSAPQAAYFDRQMQAWVLSRYADVLAALHAPRLWPAGAKRADCASVEHRDQQAGLRARTQVALSRARLLEWQQALEPAAHRGMNALPANRAVDLVEEFARPWCADLALAVTGADAADAERLMVLAEQISAAAANPDDSQLQSAARAANPELERSIPDRNIPMAAAAFVALSQTLPCFLATAWLALLRHPEELACLRYNPNLLPSAIEELLRYAGLARRIFRVALDEVTIGEATVAEGERAVLLLCSANRDGAQFPEPNQLRVTRHAGAHVALGAGPHACAGASLIRMAATFGTAALVRRLPTLEPVEPIEWRGASGFQWPAALYVRFRQSD